MQTSTRIPVLCVLVIAISTAMVGSLACQSYSKCGNGVIDKGETCDDANFDETDGCSSTCKINESAGKLCYPIPNVPAPKNAGRVNCAPVAGQPCVLCSTIGGGITGENATWDSCYPTPNPPNLSLSGKPNCLPGPFQRCIPCSGSKEVPRPAAFHRASAEEFCGDGAVNSGETCDPEFPPGRSEPDWDCLDKDCQE